jgi:antitoxin component YwqK of YwqJK toxin-antitoxin module
MVQFKEQEHWELGNLTDSAKYYYPNGMIERSGRYDNGQYDVQWKYYHTDGVVERILHYRDGLHV